VVRAVGLDLPGLFKHPLRESELLRSVLGASDQLSIQLWLLSRSAAKLVHG
jgi:hypothetical protein